jgi:hypothetical protein
MAIILPLVSSLHSEFMEKRHWQELSNIVGKQFNNYDP